LQKDAWQMAEESINGFLCPDGSISQNAPTSCVHPREAAVAFHEPLQNLLDSSPFGILVHDADGKILIFNRQLEEITGYTSAEIPCINTWIERLYPEHSA
jgi:PAS domain-containing protein